MELLRDRRTDTVRPGISAVHTRNDRGKIAHLLVRVLEIGNHRQQGQALRLAHELLGA